MDTNKSAMASGFSSTTLVFHPATNNAAHYRVPQGKKSSAMSSVQASHSETDDTDHEDDQRTGGVSLLDHPDPSPAHAMYDSSSTHDTKKQRKRNRRGAGKGTQGGVPSSIPEEPAHTFVSQQIPLSFPNWFRLSQSDYPPPRPIDCSWCPFSWDGRPNSTVNRLLTLTT